MSLFQSQLPEDWLNFLLGQYKKDLETGSLAAIHKFPAVNVKTADFIFTVCTSTFNLPVEVKYLALQCFEQTVNSSVARSSTSAARPCGYMQPQVLRQILACIQLASKMIAHPSMVQPKHVNLHFKEISKASALNMEAEMYKRLNFDLGKPTMMTSLEILLLYIDHCGFPKVEEILCVGQDVLSIITLNRWDLMVDMFKEVHGHLPKGDKEIATVQVMFKDHIFIACGVIVSSAFILDLDPNHFSVTLERATHICKDHIKHFSQSIVKCITAKMV